MFVQLNPDLDSYSETVSTLKFAERVSGVELGAARSNKEGKDVRELMEQVRLWLFVIIFLYFFGCFSFYKQHTIIIIVIIILVVIR